MDWNDLLELDAATGALIWKINAGTKQTAGTPAGYVSAKGYVLIRYKEQTYYAHRLIWEMTNGRPVPEGYEIDHEDLNKQNNCPYNLRLTTKSGNQTNKNLQNNNTSGVKGLSPCTVRQYKYWKAFVSSKRVLYRKYFEFTPNGKEQAIEWLRTTRTTLHKEFANHG